MWYTAQMKMISEWLTERHDISLHNYQLTSLQNITKVIIMPHAVKKGKASPHSIAERRVPELIPVLGSQS